MKALKEQPVIRQFFIDNEGLNKIIMEQYEKRTVLYIQLRAEGKRKRKIGVITKSTKTLKIVRNREKHLFRKLSAYGFNEYVLREGKTFDKIWLKDNFDEWKIPVEFVMKNGKYADKHGNEMKKEINYLFFQEQGFELQIFVPLTDIEQFRVLKKQNRRF